MSTQKGTWGTTATETEAGTEADFWNAGEELRFTCVLEEKISPTRKRKYILKGDFDLGANNQVENAKIISGTTALLLDSVHYSKFDVTHISIKADPYSYNFYAFLTLSLKPKVLNPKIKEIHFQFDETKIIFPPPANPQEPHWVKKIKNDDSSVQISGSAYCKIKRR